jgi:cobalt-zinc-cadmium resistance protein CzcA
MIFEKKEQPKKKRHHKHVVTTLLIFILMGWHTNTIAQTPITLQAAIDSALHNNLLVKNEQLKAKYQEALVSTSANLPQTNFLAEVGQINSIYTDSKFSLSQSFSFPTVYSKQKTLLQEEWKNSVLNIAVKEAQLRKDVAQLFFTIAWLEQKNLLLQHTDSLYRAFYIKAEQRLLKGESNVLEKASAETQLGQISMQQHQLMQELEIMQLQFQLLLNTKEAFKPSISKSKMDFFAIKDTALLREHPGLKLIQQQQQMAEAQIGLEKSKLLPDLSVGYNNTSIKGTGADNVIYGAGYRFSAVQVGVGIPIFAKSQHNRIASAKLNKQIAESNYAIGLQNLESAYRAADIKYQKQLQTVRFYEQTALKNAELISSTAIKQLAAGSINYLEWVQLINQSTLVKSDYVDAIKNLNQAIIEMNFIINQISF